MQSTKTANIEAQGATVDEAIAEAVHQLGVTREQVDVKVMDEGKKGFLGLGGRPARVFVSIRKKGERRREAAPEEPARAAADIHGAANHAREVTEKVLAQMGFTAAVTSDVRDDQVYLDVDCNDREGLLIGRKGETLQALQHLVGRITSRTFKERASVSIDIAGYRARRVEQLERRAREMAEEVMRTNRDVRTEPLIASDRRIVHRALTEMTGVETQALGNGSQKRIVIRPAGSPPIEEDEPRGRDGDRRRRRDRSDRGGRGGRRERGGAPHAAPRRRDARHDDQGGRPCRGPLGHDAKTRRARPW